MKRTWLNVTLLLLSLLVISGCGKEEPLPTDQPIIVGDTTSSGLYINTDADGSFSYSAFPLGYDERISGGWDIDFDGVSEFTYSTSRVRPSPGGSNFWQFANRFKVSRTLNVVLDDDRLKTFNAGEEINSSGDFVWTSGDYLVPKSVDGMIGFRYLQDGVYLHGWADLKLSSSGGRIRSYAFVE